MKEDEGRRMKRDGEGKWRRRPPRGGTNGGCGAYLQSTGVQRGTECRYFIDHGIGQGGNKVGGTISTKLDVLNTDSSDSAMVAHGIYPFLHPKDHGGSFHLNAGINTGIRTHGKR